MGDERAAEHRVYLHFFVREQWVCNFLEPNLQTAVGPIRFLENEEMLRSTIAGGRGKVASTIHTLDELIRQGRGAAWLSLTGEQYRRLKSGR